ncbi:MBL fold metallo-hydrolase [Olsenella sp. YH-ols2217]|uniref:MBL fold metallo-hydrolase n=1 Tax=Kribbibacterium absianum TaxID=3044210 RepID=A0ABT6ZHT4_9ACTN|nr:MULTISPECIES: MBL fold metallo-hydrolase [unclassified Olsenella]MDJ1121122.1 MBL fold metallo-hydrolase [Olsenella sp. YH-ols2216]MDJ1128613.1 MBL fold metallo-hydrolase [Olsenella sp. YH-ols2217]
MNREDWFTVEPIDHDTWVISEYGHPEETHSYVLRGRDRALLIDTGLGVLDIAEPVSRLTDLPTTAVTTHVHWDHIGSLGSFPSFCAPEAELDWLRGRFPLPEQRIRAMLLEGLDAPNGFDIDRYRVFQGEPSRLLNDDDWIDLGCRAVQALHTPGHSPGHLCFWEPERGYLFTGDLVYLGTLRADFPSTDPLAYLASLRRVAGLPVKRVLPAHHGLEVRPELLSEVRDALVDLAGCGLLRHGSGRFEYGEWAVQL